MTLFTVIYCRRSDGKLEVVTKSRAREKNEPTKDQLDAKPNAKGVSDYYRLLGPHDSKHLDWRRKLAGMLMKELGGGEFSMDKAFILDDLPENYCLYEHVKTKADAAADTKPGKTHAGGGHDRQDAYLYGHPGGRKKRYRSPADFFPHLLWLCTDESGDMMNCTCKVCSPDEIQTDSNKPAAPARGGTVSMKVDTQQVVGRNPVVQITAPSASASASASATPTTTAAVVTATTAPNPAFSRPPPAASPLNPTATAASPATTTTPVQQAPQRQATAPALPVAQSPDQQLDTTYGRLSYRIGELVWYNVGQTWALGIIIRRWILKSLPLPHGRRYLIQPLAAPFQPQTPAIVESEDGMRPWLAWSAPPFCHPGLNQAPNISFSTMDWSALMAGRYGASNNDIVKIDASILAARAIDRSYTPFGYRGNQLMPGTKPNAPLHHSTHRLHWNGVFMGGERIWIGDPVRLRMSTNEDVLVVGNIIEQPQPGQSTPKVMLVGDVYSCSTLASDAVSAERQHLIPSRMREDLDARNRVITAIGGPKSHWKLMQSGQSVDMNDVKGRWYETSLMAPPIYEKPNYEACVRAGRTDSVARTFNARADVRVLGGMRVERREAAIGQAAPQGLRLVEGIDEPAPGELPQAQPQRPTQAPPQQQQQLDERAQVPVQSEFEQQMAAAQQEQGDGMEQFMHLDAMDSGEGMPGFGQEYASQGGYFP